MSCMSFPDLLRILLTPTSTLSQYWSQNRVHILGPQGFVNLLIVVGNSDQQSFFSNNHAMIENQYLFMQ